MADPMGMPHDLMERSKLESYLVMASKIMAISGGLLFLALIAMSLVSIIGRKLGFGSVNGDIELMQAGTAVAATAFLPYCTLLGEHIKVDFFTENMRDAIKLPIDGVTEVLFAMMSAILAWRTVLSTIDVYASHEVTPLVSLPLWIPTVLLVPGLALMAICAIYRAWAHFSPTTRIPGESR